MDWIWPLLASPFAGSFLGVLARRLPHGRLLSPSRSCCEACGATLALRDLVPVASFLALRGRCRTCAVPIAPQHLYIECAAIAVAAGTAVAGAPWTTCLFGWAALALAWIDWEWLLLPDAITLPLALVGLGVTEWEEPWMMTDHAIAAALGFLSLQALAWAYRRYRGQDGIGAGDAKFLAAIGAWVGLDGLPLVIGGAAMLGIALAVVLKTIGRPVDRNIALPFGTCLALAAWIVLLAG